MLLSLCSYKPDGKVGGSRHTFNYDLINSQDPTAKLSSTWSIPSVPRREKLHRHLPTQKPLRLSPPSGHGREVAGDVRQLIVL
jgi:hypothetical protein